MQGTIEVDSEGRIEKIEVCVEGARYRIWKEEGQIKCVEIFSGNEISDLSQLPRLHIRSVQEAVNLFFARFGAPSAAMDPTEGGKFRVGSLESCVDSPGIN